MFSRFSCSRQADAAEGAADIERLSSQFLRCYGHYHLSEARFLASGRGFVNFAIDYPRFESPIKMRANARSLLRHEIA